MKITLAFILALFAFLAHATGKPPVPAPTPNATQHQTQTQAQAIDMSLYTNPVASQSSGNTYVLPAPAAAAPLPSGLCPLGSSESFSIVWGFVSWAKSSMKTEHECLDKLIAYGKETQPKPAQTVVNYISPPPAAQPEPAKPVECAKPAPKKPVKAQPKQCK